MGQGSFGEIKCFNDFTAPLEATVPTTTGNLLGGGWSVVGVNEGSLGWVVDEPGGILQVTTDTGDNDNEVLVAGPFKPSDGGCVMEARLKAADPTTATKMAIFVGFTETLSLTTPVMPAETATTTTTYNGTGNMVGFVLDSDATTIRWRFVAGNAGAALATANPAGTAGAALGIIAGTPVADRWVIIRVEIGPDGRAVGYFTDSDTTTLTEVGHTTTSLTSTDLEHAVILSENRDGGAEVIEIDYAYARGWRDWSIA